MVYINEKDKETEIQREIAGEPEPDEERIVGPADEGDNDPDDTTPNEATEQADEGEEIFKEERKRHQTHDPLSE